MDWCLITDIDGTLIGEGESTDELRRTVLAARRRLARRHRRLRWVIATGRDYQSTCEVLVDHGFSLDDFDALVTSVGAELYLAGAASPDAEYQARLLASGFDAELVRAALEPLALAAQPPHEQFPFKVSYYAGDTPALRARLLEALARLSFETSLVFAMGDYLDVAPSCGAKGGAVAHLLEHWRVPPSRAVAAGDSGNDLSMLDRQWHGIVVGNGCHTLAALRGAPRVFFAQRKYAGGVLEGLRRLGFLDPETHR